MWRYSPSHSTLLLLANKDDTHATRRAYVFKGVESIDIPTNFYCSQISWDKDAESKIFNFHAQDAVHSLVGFAIITDEDELDHYEPVSIYDDLFKL